MFIEEREIWALKKSCKRDSYKSKSKKACIQTCMVNLPKRNFFLTSSFSPAKSRDIRTIINQLQIIWNTNWFLPPKLWLHVWFIYIKNRQLNSLLFLHTECPKICRKSVRYQLKYRFAGYSSRCSTDLR